MARGVANGSRIAGRRGAAATLAFALCTVALPLFAQPAAIVSPMDALPHISRFCGAPTQETPTAMKTALPHVPHATGDASARWVFDGGFGARKDQQMYRRTGFVISGSDGVTHRVTHWELDWTAETPR